MAAAKDFEPPEIPSHYLSTVSGKEYVYTDYANIDEPKRGFLPLPKDEYPYTLIYKINPKANYTF